MEKMFKQSLKLINPQWGKLQCNNSSLNSLKSLFKGQAYFSLLFFISLQLALSQNALVFQSDFGLKDGAVSAMKGVAFAVDSQLPIFDITHDIPPFNIWEASYRLAQAAPYWPEGTVFVSVVDPGVGSERKSVVMKSMSGHYFVTPDNGTLTMVAHLLGVAEVHEIDENTNRLQGSELSHTFHGRDVYAYTGARLASDKISFAEVGPKLGNQVELIAYQKATINGGKLLGNIPILDVNYGNVWTNINRELFDEFNPDYGDQFCIIISQNNESIWEGKAPFVKTFGDVEMGAPLLYYNSLLNVSLALNWDDFAGKNGIGSGSEWSIEISRCDE